MKGSVVNKGNIIPAPEDFFTIDACGDERLAEQMTDSLFCVQFSEMHKRYGNYHMTFYRKSSKTNLEYLTKHPGELDIDSDHSDYFMGYSIGIGNHMTKSKFVKNDLEFLHTRFCERLK